MARGMFSRSLGSREQGPIGQCWTEISRGKGVLCDLEKQGHGSRKVGPQAAHSGTPMQVELGINKYMH